jgi:phospholipid/cholesterol/gamma-HCH transport system permease protein
MNRKTTILERYDRSTSVKAVERIGASAIGHIQVAGRAVLLFLDACAHLPQIGRSAATLIRQIDVSGIGSIVVLSLIAFLTGMIMAVQTGSELEKFGVISNLGAIIGATFVREMGPIWAAIIMLSRVGAAMAAELGTMTVNEEVDALRVMSINPVRYLVLPRILALVIAMPLLTVLADIVGMMGGAMVASQMFNRPTDEFMASARSVITGLDFFSGLGKAVVFGAIIGTIACDRGLNTTDGAEGVGRATTQTVVLSVVFVLLSDLVMTSFVQVFLKQAVG